MRIGSAAFLAEGGLGVPDLENAHGTALDVASDRDFLGMLVIADSLSLRQYRR